MELRIALCSQDMGFRAGIHEVDFSRALRRVGNRDFVSEQGDNADYWTPSIGRDDLEVHELGPVQTEPVTVPPRYVRALVKVSGGIWSREGQQGAVAD
jgi:hypothetical protein